MLSSPQKYYGSKKEGKESSKAQASKEGSEEDCKEGQEVITPQVVSLASVEHKRTPSSEGVLLCAVGIGVVRV